MRLTLIINSRIGSWITPDVSFNVTLNLLSKVISHISIWLFGIEYFNIVLRTLSLDTATMTLIIKWLVTIWLHIRSMIISYSKLTISFSTHMLSREHCCLVRRCWTLKHSIRSGWWLLLSRIVRWFLFISLHLSNLVRIWLISSQSSFFNSTIVFFVFLTLLVFFLNFLDFFLNSPVLKHSIATSNIVFIV